MSDEMMDDGVSRRRFIQAVLATGAAATAVGTGAALINKKEAVPVVMPSNPAPMINPLPSNADNSELMAQIVAIQADNVRLQSELDSASRRIQSMQGTDNDQNLVLDNLHLELSDANSQLSIFAGLVSLYEQLENVDLSALAQQGLTTVGDAVSELIDDIPTLEEGIDAGLDALAELEEQVPFLQVARDWIENKVARLGFMLQAVEDLLRNVVEQTGPFLQMLSQWFQEVLSWLPFGMGATASNIVSALTDLITEAPDTVAGLQTTVVQPLAWFTPDINNEIPVHARLITPLRTNALTKATNMTTKVQTMQTTYKTQLETPLQAAATNRSAIKEQIQLYRELHKM